jgi:ATP-binding cassette subfamily B protein
MMNSEHEKPLLKKILSKCIYFIFSVKKTQVCFLILLIIISGIAPSIDSILLQNITDQIESYSDQDITGIDLASILSKWVIIYALWWESMNLLWRLYDYIYLKTMPEIKAHVIEKFYDYTQYHEHNFFQTTLAGDISNRITEAARSMEMIFSYGNEQILRQLAILLFALITLYTVHQHIAAIFLIWIISFIGISLYFSKTLKNYSTLYGKDKALVAGKIVDSIANISAIRIFSSYKHESKYLRNYTNKSINSDQNMQWFMLKLRYVLGISCTLMMTTQIYYIINLRSNLEISIGECILIITLCVSVMEEIWGLTQSFGDLFEQIGSFSQSMSLLKKYEIHDDLNAEPLKVKTPVIEFKNVTFKFRNNNNVFKNQSIIIKAYERVGLVGFSGSGKTTFASMIFRLYDIEEGSILIDNRDISKVPQNSLRDNISIIPQEPILFHRSILENIRYGNLKASDEEIYEAAKASYIHDFILDLPDGYNTICGERGNNLSGGQRQLIIIARALLKKASILILDEATSSLDTHTEHLIHQSLQNLMQGKTVLIIAHKLSTFLNMDRILVFKNGNIVEDGTHSELQKDGNIYKMLWNHC